MPQFLVRNQDGNSIPLVLAESRLQQVYVENTMTCRELEAPKKCLEYWVTRQPHAAMLMFLFQLGNTGAVLLFLLNWKRNKAHSRIPPVIIESSLSRIPPGSSQDWAGEYLNPWVIAKSRFTLTLWEHSMVPVHTENNAQRYQKQFKALMYSNNTASIMMMIHYSYKTSNLLTNMLYKCILYNLIWIWILF